MKRLIAIIAASLLLLAAGCSKIPTSSGISLKVVAPRYLSKIFDLAAFQFEAEHDAKITMIYVHPDSVFEKARSLMGIDLVFFRNPDNAQTIAKDTLFNLKTFSSPFKLTLIMANRTDGPQIKDVSHLTDSAIRRIVIINPAKSYEGNLTKRVLEKYKVWDKIQSKLIRADSPQHLRSFLTTGEADAVVAFELSLNEYFDAVIKQRFDDYLEKRLDICGVVMTKTKEPGPARAFLDFFDSPMCEIYGLLGVVQKNIRRQGN